MISSYLLALHLLAAAKVSANSALPDVQKMWLALYRGRR